MSGHLYLGNKQVKKLFLGNKKVKNSYLGNSSVYSGAAGVTYKVDTNLSYTEEIEDGADATKPTSFTPAKSGWTFVGWREDSTASSAVLSSKIITDDKPITLYAVFQANVTVTYNGNGQTGGSTAAETKQRYYNNNNIANPSFTVKANGFTKTNYTFYRWRTAASSGTIYTVNSTISNVAADMILYAYWLVTTTSFNYTGGIQSFAALAGVTYTLKVWGAQGGSAYNVGTTAPVGKGANGAYATGNYKPASNVTLYVVVGGAGGYSSSGTSASNCRAGEAGYNCGGAGSAKWTSLTNKNSAGGGGGATHIGSGNALINSTTPFICAGGGGGGFHMCLGSTSSSVKDGLSVASSNEVRGTGTVGNTAKGAGGGGWYGGNPGYSGTNYTDGVTSASTSQGQREGNGYAQIVVAAV